MPIIDTDLLCVQCGYNLRTQSADGTCPECGSPIAESLRNRLRECGPHNLAIMRTGIAALVLGFAFMILGSLESFVIFVPMLRSPPANNPWVQWPSQMIGGVMVFAMVVFALWRARTLTWRGWVGLLGLTAALLPLAFYNHGPSNWVFISSFVSSVVTTCLAVGFWLITSAAVTDTRRWPRFFVAAVWVWWAVSCAQTFYFTINSSLSYLLMRIVQLLYYLFIAIALHQLATLAMFGHARDLAALGLRVRNAMGIVFLVVVALSILFMYIPLMPPGVALAVYVLSRSIAIMGVFAWVIFFLIRFWRHLRTLT